MKIEDPSEPWKQHFPTYSFRERDIAIQEYAAAVRGLEGEERLFLNATQVVLVIGAAFGSLAFGTADRVENGLRPFLAPAVTLGMLLAAALVLSFVTVRYFADRQKAIVYAARKTIVLRRMLGLSFGSLQLVLPNWRVEGADEPFAIRLFPGWGTYVAYPCAVVAVTSGGVIVVLAARLANSLFNISSEPEVLLQLIALAIGATWSVFLAIAYRRALLDRHESLRLLLTKAIARLIALRLVGNVEYIIYRAKLAVFEVHRLGVNLETLGDTLIFLEDRAFHRHHGVSARALLRAAAGLTPLKRRSGGSTITQQLVRTLFVVDMTKLIRRKLIELPLAFWFERFVEKREILEMYLASVRFERGVFGIVAAMKHFFGEVKQTPSRSEAFVLVERISNVRSGILGERVRSIQRQCIQNGILLPVDLPEIQGHYERLVTEGKVRDAENSRRHLLGTHEIVVKGENGS